jgi:hypothetical protein
MTCCTSTDPIAFVGHKWGPGPRGLAGVNPLHRDAIDRALTASPMLQPAVATSGGLGSAGTRCLAGTATDRLIST